MIKDNTESVWGMLNGVFTTPTFIVKDDSEYSDDGIDFKWNTKNTLLVWQTFKVSLSVVCGVQTLQRTIIDDPSATAASYNDGLNDDWMDPYNSVDEAI